jgi:hypothetical protein
VAAVLEAVRMDRTLLSPVSVTNSSTPSTEALMVKQRATSPTLTTRRMTARRTRTSPIVKVVTTPLTLLALAPTRGEATRMPCRQKIMAIVVGCILKRNGKFIARPSCLPTF